MSTQQLNPYHDNTPIVTFQCAIHAMIFQHGMFKKIQPDEQDKTVATQSKAACNFIIEFTGRFYDLDKSSMCLCIHQGLYMDCYTA